MRETMIDFHAGYYVSVFMAFVFLVLGRMVMYGSGTELSAQGSVFARQLIDLYSESIGAWTRPLIIVAAFSAMFSTTLTTIDAYPRALANTTTLLFPKLVKQFKPIQLFWIISGVSGSFLIINFFVDQLGDMLTLAMTVSFLAAPIFAIINFRAMSLPHVPEKYKPKRWEVVLSILGIIFLVGFGVVFLIWMLL